MSETEPFGPFECAFCDALRSEDVTLHDGTEISLCPEHYDAVRCLLRGDQA